MSFLQRHRQQMCCAWHQRASPSLQHADLYLLGRSRKRSEAFRAEKLEPPYTQLYVARDKTTKRNLTCGEFIEDPLCGENR